MVKWPSSEVVKKGVLLVLGLYIGLFAFGANGAIAGTFASASMRPDRAKTSQTNVPILVVLKPSTDSIAGIESVVRIAFSSKFTVNGSASSITTSTTGMPATYGGTALVAMPGISATASSVSGQTVNFSINNLTAGTQYGFYVSSGISTTTAGNYASTLYTRDGSGVIDSQNVGVSITANDQVNVTATIPASASDGEVSISSDTAEGTTLVPLDIVTMTLSYRSDLNTAQSMELVGSWEEGLIVGSGSQYVEVFEYVAGSAGDAYGGSEPVIDTVNRTITWDISALPPSITPYTVSFQLRVRSDISTTQQLSTSVHVDATLVTTPLPQDDWDFFVEKPEEIVPTATPTPTPGPTSAVEDEEDDDDSIGPTSTPAPGIPTPAPTGTTASPAVNSVQVESLSATTATITVTTSIPSTITLMYGTSPQSLSSVLKSSSQSLKHTFYLVGLNPNTQYLYRFSGLSSTNKSFTSDLYTFTTALQDALSRITSSSILWETLALSIADVQVDRLHDTFVYTGSPITVRLHVDNPGLVRKMVARIVPASLAKSRTDSNILGITTAAPFIPDIQSELVETLPGVFSGTLAAPKTPGNYMIEVKTTTIYGGFSLAHLPGTMYVSSPISIVSHGTDEVIEGATVVIFKFNEFTQLYERLDVAIPLQSLTNEAGLLNVNLPYGTYKAVISAPGYKSQEKIFALNGENTAYPQISLQRAGFMVAFLDKLGFSWRESLQYMWISINGLAASALVARAVITVMIICILLNVLRSIDMSALSFTQAVFKRKGAASHIEAFVLWMIHIAHFVLNATFGTAFMTFVFARLSQLSIGENLLLISVYGLFLISWFAYLYILWRDYERFQFNTKS